MNNGVLNKYIYLYNIDKYNLDIIVNNILNNINNDENIDEFTYIVMLFEFKIKGFSKIFEYIKSNKIINDFFIKELEKDINRLNNDLSKNRNKIKKNNKKIKWLKKTIKNNSQQIKNERNKIINSIIKLTIFTSLCIGIVFSNNKIGKKISKEYKVINEHFSYSSYLDNNINETYKHKDIDNYVIIKEYQPYKLIDNIYQREIITYDVSNIQYNNIEDYLNIDLNDLGITKNIDIQYKSNLKENDLYKNNIYEVISNKVDLNDTKYNEFILWLITIISSSISIYLLITLDILLCENVKTLLIGSIDDLQNINTKKYIIIKKNNIKLLKDYLDKEKELLQYNQDLKNKFINNNYQRLLQKKDS